jgi:hypothetical protein
MLLAGLLATLFFFEKGRSHSAQERLLVYAALLLVGGLLTRLCNRILRPQLRGGAAVASREVSESEGRTDFDPK